jgi:predicted RNA-binding Zn ribbon-like protein
MFIADALGLDFLNSVATPVDTEVEWLANGSDLVAWLEQAGQLPPHEASAFRTMAQRGELDLVAKQARELREWFRGFVRRHKGKPLRGKAGDKPPAAAVIDELEPLNRVLAQDQAFGQIVAPEPDQAAEASTALAWRMLRRWEAPEALLLPIAQALAELVCAEDFSHVKACEGAACTLVFLDRTRGHGRRWCSMAVCGNRAKQAAHRKRVSHA